MGDVIVKFIVSWLTKPEALSIIVGVVMFFVKSLLKDKYSKNEAVFGQGVDIAFNMVNDLSKRTENKVDDKVAEGLKALQAYLATHGQSPTEKQLERAKLLFQAMNGAGK
jgi:hypothetical protein